MAVITIGNLPARRAQDALIRHRLFRAVWYGQPGPLRFGRPQQVENGMQRGVLRWSECRRALGGRVDAAAFRRAVDELVAAGRLIEVWMRARNRMISHGLLIPGFSSALPYPVCMARGREDVMAREVWAEGLGVSSGATGTSIRQIGDNED